VSRPSGWQQVSFSAPVAVNRRHPPTSRPTLQPSGHYSFTANAFGAAVDNPPLHAARERYDPERSVPVQLHERPSRPTASMPANYFVDVMFKPEPCSPRPPGAPIGVTRHASQRLGDGFPWTAPRQRREPDHELQPSTHRFAGASAPHRNRRVRIAAGDLGPSSVGLPNGTSYTFQVAATNAVGTGFGLHVQRRDAARPRPSAPARSSVPPHRRPSTPATRGPSCSASPSPPTHTTGVRQRGPPSTRRPRTPGPTWARLWSAGRAAPGVSDLHRGVRPPVGSRSASSRPDRRQPQGPATFASYLAPAGHYSVDAAGVWLGRGGQPAAATHWRTARHPTALYLYRRDKRLPDEQLQRQQLLGGPSSTSRGPRPSPARRAAWRRAPGYPGPRRRSRGRRRATAAAR